jgi:diguanylate cyclase (GGDEF)-like protein/PAS domain S-box-containing protein
MGGVYACTTEDVATMNDQQRESDAARMLDLLPELVNRFRVDDLTIVYCNQAWADFYGVDREMAMGQQLDTFLSADDTAGLHDQLARLTPESPVHTDVQARSAPGDVEQYLEWADRLIEGPQGLEVLSVGRDVTTRVLADKARGLSDQLFRQLADGSTDIVWRFATVPEMRVEYLSPSVETILGYPPSHFADDYQRVFELVVPEDAALVEAMLAGAEMAGRFDVRMRHRDGRLVTLETESAVLPGALQGVSRDVSEIRSLQARLAEMALRDSLTGLANRRLVTELLETAASRSRRSGAPIAVAFLDVDGLKSVNDNYGHDAGDVVLCETAKRLVDCVRSADVVGRLGGDEFVVVFEPGSISIDEVERRISAALSAPISLPNGEQVFCPASIGIADTTTTAADPAELMAAADLAMYSAKRRRRHSPS